MSDQQMQLPVVPPQRTAHTTLPLTRRSLAAAIAAAVKATAGVHQLQPTLTADGPSRLVRPGRTDGVHVLVRGDLVDTDVYLATASTHQARTVASHVHDRVVEIVTAAGRRPGATTINVLAIEPRAD